MYLTSFQAKTSDYGSLSGVFRDHSQFLPIPDPSIRPRPIWILEGAVPLFSVSYRRFRHAGLNLVFTLTTLLVNLSLAFVIIWSADVAVSQQFGVMQWVTAPLWLSIVLGLLTLDLISAWFVHGLSTE